MSSSRITRSASAAAAADAAAAAEAEPGSLSDIENDIADAGARTDDDDYEDSHDSFAEVDVEVDDEQSFSRARARAPARCSHTGDRLAGQGDVHRIVPQNQRGQKGVPAGREFSRSMLCAYQPRQRLRRFITTVSPDEITIIVPAFDGLLTVGGKFREPLTNKVDNWIREQKLTPKQRLRVLSNPSAGEMIAMVEDPYSRDFRVGVVDAEEEDYLAAMVDLRPLNALLSLGSASSGMVHVSRASSALSGRKSTIAAK